MSKMTASVQMETKTWKQFQVECKKQGAVPQHVLKYLIEVFLENTEEKIKEYYQNKIKD